MTGVLTDDLNRKKQFNLVATLIIYFAAETKYNVKEKGDMQSQQLKC